MSLVKARVFSFTHLGVLSYIDFKILKL